MQPPSQPMLLPKMSQSTSSCSEREIDLLVWSLVIPSMAATTENAQQPPIYIYMHNIYKYIFSKARDKS